MKRRIWAFSLFVMLLCLAVALGGCMGTGSSDATSESESNFNSDRPVKEKATDRSDDGDASGDDGGAATDDATSDSRAADAVGAGDDSAFDTWSADCWDAKGNPSVTALLELKGWQLLTFLNQQGFTWDDTLEMFESDDGRVFSMSLIDKDGSTKWMHEGEIEGLDKGAVGARAMMTLQLSGYTSAEEVLSNVTVPIEDRYQLGSGSWIAVVYGSNMARHILVVSQQEDGNFKIDLITEEAIKTGVFTQGGGAPTISEFWFEKTGRQL